MVRSLCLISALVAVVGLAGCGSSASKATPTVTPSSTAPSAAPSVPVPTVESSSAAAPQIMPNVVGRTLDVAESAITNAGFQGKVGTQGAGVLGVWVASDWTVCAQAPAAGQPLSGTPELTISHSCPNGSSSSASKAPTKAAPTGPITVANNKEFAAMLVDPTGDCDKKTADFAKQYADDELDFTGRATNIASHNGQTYFFDVLVNVGLKGPNFKFDGVEMMPGGPVPPGIGLPANSRPLTQGDRVHIVAKVDNFNATQCLFYLDAVSATIVH